MSNYYKKMHKIAFKSRSLIDQTDDAFRDPYNLKEEKPSGQENLKTPGDVSTTGFGYDFMEDRKPPEPWSATEERSLIPKWNDSHDGSDPDLNDSRPSMNNGFGWYSSENPLSPSRDAARSIEKPDRDNSVIGPHNQHDSINQSDFFDKLRRRVR